MNKEIFISFIKFQYIETRKGNFIDIDTGQVVGEHSGLHKWTVGQRCCLANWKDAYFIFKKDLNTNDIYVVGIIFTLFKFLTCCQKPHRANITFAHTLH